jgi:hypothetical protein
MAKLIRSSIECAYKIGTICLHNHNHGQPTLLECNPKGEDNFPVNCPLEDGYTKHIEFEYKEPGGDS